MYGKAVVTAAVLALLLATYAQLAVPAPVAASSGAAGGWRLVYGLSVNAVLYYNITSKSELVGARLFNGNVLIYLKPLNATYVEVKAVFKGVVEGVGSVRVCDYSLKNCRSVPYQEFLKLTNATSREVSASATFIVDRRFNYAWMVLGGGRREFVGFLPLYVVPDISYSNASEHQLLYMGRELGVVKASNGEPLPAHISLGGRTVYAIMFKNPLVTIYVIHHYPVTVNGYIPVPAGGMGTNTTLGYGYCSALKDFYSSIFKVNNYPSGAVSVSWGKVAVLAAAFGGAAAIAAYAVVRRRR